MKEVHDLLARLRNPKIDLFEERECLQHVRSLGMGALEPLLNSILSEEFHGASKALQALIEGFPEDSAERTAASLAMRDALAKGLPLGRRKVAIEGLSKYGGRREVTGWLVDLVMDVSDDPSTRNKALWALCKLHLNPDHAERLVSLLKPSEPRDFLNAILACLSANTGVLPLKQAQDALDHFLISTDSEVRGRAIELLGQIGEVDAIERVCMLPVAASEVEGIKRMVESILKRPCNLLHLRPDYFEKFIGQVARKMGYETVNVTGKPGDGGVDINAIRYQPGFGRTEVEPWVIQCKRYDPASRVSPSAVQELIDVRRSRRAAKALLITTSSYTKEAVALATEHAPDIRLITGPELLEHLDQFFGKDRYTIKSRG